MAENALSTLFGDIADSIRSKTGGTDTMKPAEFPEQIRSIESSNVIDNVEIALDFSNGDLTERLPEGYSANSVTIFKPDTLVAENIAEGVTIAGIVGTHKGGSGGSVEGTATVTFCNYDGSVLYTRLVFIGDDCASPVTQSKLDTPTRASDVQYNYTFSGWSATKGGSASSTVLKNITADKTVYAAYTTSLVYYTVRFYDGATLMKESTVAYGATATPPDTTKEGYGFIGWTPSDLTITADTDFYGTWEEQHVDANGQITDSWETIIASIDNGNYKSYYSVGNYKPLDTGADGIVNMQIVAFDLDIKADGSGNAPITWIAKELLVNQKAHGAYAQCQYWSKSKIRTYLNETVKSNLPSCVQNAIVSVEKISRGYDTTNSNFINETTTDMLWIPSVYELEGKNYEAAGVHYTYTATNTNPVYRASTYTNKPKPIIGTDTNVTWFARSINSKWNGYIFDSTGRVSNSDYSSAKGVCLGFCT